MPPNNGFVCTVSKEESAELKKILQEKNWEFSSCPYAEYRASSLTEKVNVTVYTSGKLVVQGKDTADFVQFCLEPEVLHTFTYGYTPEEIRGETVTPHGGIDESGKGDFFGPLVVAAAYVDETTAPLLREAGVCDSKAVSSDRKLLQIAAKVRNIIPGKYTVLVLKPETYNRLYAQIGNLNRLLAWGHARCIENLLELVPDCPRMISDKFGNETLIRRALMTRGRQTVLEQKTKAESDVAVAAASILARENFLLGMQKLAETTGIELPKGAGPKVKATGKELMAKNGRGFFVNIAKTHFKTFTELCNGN